MATQTSSTYAVNPPRAHHVGENRMHGTAVSGLTPNTLSASDELWLFPIPARCLVTGGMIRGSLPAAGVTGQTVIKLGTREDDDYFGTYTVSGGAALPPTRLSLAGIITVSASDDFLPYQQPVIATVNSAPTTATASLSLYVVLEYVMPGNA
jgi:hypothetical protein